MLPTDTSPPTEELVEKLLITLKQKAENLELVEDELHQMGIFDWVGREQWRALDPVLIEEYHQRARELTRRYVQNLVREKLIHDWLERYTPVKSDRERNSVERTIEDHLRADREEELTEYLADVVTGGIKQADKNREKRQRTGGYGGHAWAVATGLARVILVVGVLGIAQSRFETIMYAMLVLIYNGVDAAYRGAGYSTMLMAFGIDNQFKRVIRKLKSDEPTWERETRLETEKKTEKDGARSVIRFYISSSFIGITWLYAMLKLVAAVFF
jgi:hypothetical protein